MSLRLCLVRHGETAWNAEGRLQGWTDVPLNAAGRQQAAQLAAALQGQHFEAIVSSPLQRALQTAQAVAAGRPVDIEPDARERHFGALQGLTRDEVAQRFPSVHAALQARQPDYTPPEGESLAVFAARVRALLGALRARPAGPLLLVAHGGVLDLAYRLASGQSLASPRRQSLPNAALNWLRATPEGWAVDSWGDTRHLQAEARDEF